MARKKAPPPKPSEIKTVVRDPGFITIKRRVYTGEEAKRARQEAEKRRVLNDQSWRSAEEDLPKRNKIILRFCQAYLRGSLRLPSDRLSDDWGPEVEEAFRRWYALPAQEAVWLGFWLGQMVGRHSKEREALAQKRAGGTLKQQQDPNREAMDLWDHEYMDAGCPRLPLFKRALKSKGWSWATFSSDSAGGRSTILKKGEHVITPPDGKPWPTTGAALRQRMRTCRLRASAAAGKNALV